MLDMRQLLALQAVHAEGSVARAAQRLGLSQPSVDYHLKALEQETGVTLVRRTNRGSMLTSAALVLVERGQEILSLAEKAVAEVRDLAHLGRQRLSFGSFPTAAALLLPSVAARMREIGIELDVVLAEVAPLVARVNAHELDAALLYVAPDKRLPVRRDIELTHLLTDPLLLAIPDSRAQDMPRVLDPQHLTQLHDLSWVLGATPGDTIDEVVHEALSGSQVRVSVRTDDYSVAMGLVAAQMGVALVPKLAAVNVPDGVTLRPMSDERFAREIVLAVAAEPKGNQVVSAQLAEALRRAIEVA